MDASLWTTRQVILDARHLAGSTGGKVLKNARDLGEIFGPGRVDDQLVTSKTPTWDQTRVLTFRILLMADEWVVRRTSELA